MRIVNMHEAKTSLSKLVPFHVPEGLRPVGLHRLPPEEADNSFVDETMRPLTAHELRTWTESIAPNEEPA